MKKFQEVLCYNDKKTLEEYLNKKINLKVQERDVDDLIELYKNNKLNLLHYLRLLEEYPYENLRYINYKYKSQNHETDYLKAS